MRLSDGGSRYGRVELCVSEIWTTVCSDYWGYEDASVICRQLGYSPHGNIIANNIMYGTVFYLKVLFLLPIIILTMIGLIVFLIQTVQALSLIYGIVLIMKLLILICVLEMMMLESSVRVRSIV